ncbi:MAG: HTH domain-containing protein [Enterococcus sp.]
MLTKKEKELIAYLDKKNRWITSDELAEYSNCTTRTIRNRVAKINQNNPSLILTSHLGYQLNSEAKLTSDGTEDRKSRIFLELLKHSSNGVDFYDLAALLFISESTLKNDIQQLKKEITNDAIQIIFDQDYIKLTGPERAKRRYLISLLYNESDVQEKLKVSIHSANDRLYLAGKIAADDSRCFSRAHDSNQSIFLKQYCSTLCHQYRADSPRT